MSFSESNWQKIAPIYTQIIQHPFNVKLANGTLEKESFNFYIEQDAFYLNAFSRSLAFIAARANSSEITQHFLNFALGALVDERELHAKFIKSGSNWDQIEPTAACLAYTQFLLSTTAIAPLEEAIAAVIPCFWIYREVGLHIAAQSLKDNPYSAWITTYSDIKFSEATDLAISILDAIASQSTAKTRQAMEKAFEYSTLLEWHFWNDAYKMVIFREAHCPELLPA